MTVLSSPKRQIQENCFRRYVRETKHQIKTISKILIKYSSTEFQLGVILVNKTILTNFMQEKTITKLASNVSLPEL